MARKFLVILAIGVFLIMGLGVFVGCTNRNSIEFTVRENAFLFATIYDYPESRALEALIRSTVDLQELMQENNIIIESSHYDDEFFTENAIVVLYSYADGVNVRSVEVDGNTLKVNLTRYRIFVGNTHVHHGRSHYIIIEISQADISDVEALQIISRQRRAR